MKKVKTFEGKKYAVMKEKCLLLLLLWQFINNRKKPRKNSIRKLILLRKRFFDSQSLNVASSITDLKARRRVWTFYRDLLARSPFAKIFFGTCFKILDLLLSESESLLALISSSEMEFAPTCFFLVNS